jgi:hypothetical protein
MTLYNRRGVGASKRTLPSKAAAGGSAVVITPEGASPGDESSVRPLGRVPVLMYGAGRNFLPLSIALRRMAGNIGSNLLAYFREQTWVSPLLFVMTVGYSSITSSALNMFNCLPYTMAGITYHNQDLAVECYTPEHTLFRIIAGIVIAAFVMAIPVLIFVLLSRNAKLLRSEAIQSRYGFLLVGYAIDRPVPVSSWESVIMLRRALVVCIGALVRDPFYQSFAGLGLFCLALFLQASYQPYERKLFNVLETLSVAGIIITQLISLFYLRWQTILAKCDGEPDSTIATIDGSTCGELLVRKASSDVGTTIVLVLVNFGLLFALGFFLVRSSLPAALATLRQLWGSAQSTLLGAGLVRRSGSDPADAKPPALDGRGGKANGGSAAAAMEPSGERFAGDTGLRSKRPSAVLTHDGRSTGIGGEATARAVAADSAAGSAAAADDSSVMTVRNPLAHSMLASAVDTGPRARFSWKLHVAPALPGDSTDTLDGSGSGGASRRMPADVAAAAQLSKPAAALTKLKNRVRDGERAGGGGGGTGGGRRRSSAAAGKCAGVFCPHCSHCAGAASDNLAECSLATIDATAKRDESCAAAANAVEEPAAQALATQADSAAEEATVSALAADDEPDAHESAVYTEPQCGAGAAHGCGLSAAALTSDAAAPGLHAAAPPPAPAPAVVTNPMQRQRSDSDAADLAMNAGAIVAPSQSRAVTAASAGEALQPSFPAPASAPQLAAPTSDGPALLAVSAATGSDALAPADYTAALSAAPTPAQIAAPVSRAVRKVVRMTLAFNSTGALGDVLPGANAVSGDELGAREFDGSRAFGTGLGAASEPGSNAAAALGFPSSLAPRSAVVFTAGAGSTRESVRSAAVPSAPSSVSSYATAAGAATAAASAGSGGMLSGMFARAALGLGGSSSGAGHPHAGSAAASASSASRGDSKEAPLAAQRSRMTLGNGGALSRLGPVRARSGVASTSAGVPRGAAKEASPSARSGQGTGMQGQYAALVRGARQPASDVWATAAAPLQRSANSVVTQAVLTAAPRLSPSFAPVPGGAPLRQDRAGGVAALAALRSPPQQSLAADAGSVSPYSITGDAWGNADSDGDGSDDSGVPDDGYDDDWGVDGAFALAASAFASAGVKPATLRRDAEGAATTVVHLPARDVWTDDSDGDGGSSRSRVNSPASSATADSSAASRLEFSRPLAPVSQRYADGGATTAAVPRTSTALPYAVSRARPLAPRTHAEEQAPAVTARATSLTRGDGDTDGEVW